MNLKKGSTSIAIAGLLLIGGLTAEAGTSYSNTLYASVPGSNGSKSTPSQVKAKTNASSDLSISKISVKNKMDTRAIGGGSNGVKSGPWVRDTNVGSYAIPNPTGAGWSTSLTYSSDYLSSGMTVTYKWRSN